MNRVSARYRWNKDWVYQEEWHNRPCQHEFSWDEDLLVDPEPGFPGLLLLCYRQAISFGEIQVEDVKMMFSSTDITSTAAWQYAIS
ncbi:hypothetical protein AAES_157290 [Amazona aestiva]|uniref:Uncharacterized protein n=1 Tax=Amazona aestiva TaxID=12930 RepID=A0A0Q3LVP1_AMAAE|nr:hypothetical protein AAES_157290 [Amazona aestiva]